MHFSLIIPCYLDAAHLEKNFLTLQTYLSSTCLAYEIIFVNDASPDGTKEVLAKIKTSFQHIVVHHHDANRGRGAAVMTGLGLAKGKYAGFIDIDLEHLHDAIIVMLIRMESENIDVITGRRLMVHPTRYLARTVASLIYRKIALLILAMPFEDTETGLKIFRREKILTLLPKMKNLGWFWDTEIIHRAWKSGFKIIEHPIIFQKDLTKKSTVRLFRDSWQYLKDLIQYKNYN